MGSTIPAASGPAVAILFDGQQGVPALIRERGAIMTRCSDTSLTSIWSARASLDRVAGGEVLPVTQRIKERNADVTVVVLGQASRFTPRAVATGWARFDIQNGASVAIVGYGAIDRNASQGKAELQEAMSTITDFDCSIMPGCDVNELGAGGNGIDSCNGDSGGPLYLVTEYGEFLVGVTSRAYSDAVDPCGEGGIYGRPDQIIDFIDQAAGVQVEARPGAPSRVEAIAVRPARP
jgi:secreted trypsin-like serine protease